MMSPSEIRRWIEKHREPFETLKSFSSDWIRDELHWMCDHEQTNESYLEVERKGRGTRLSKRQRAEMKTLLQSYRAYLTKSKRSDWSEWPLQLLERASNSPASMLFDHLLIDEAQFFAPVWLKLLQLALKPGGHLFLCADPTQGFLHRKQSWVQVGLNARNRSHRLERPYRCSAAILAFAREFYKRRMPDDDEPLNLPSEKWFETLEPGVPPIIVASGSLHDQLTNLETELRSLEQAGVPKHHILILVAGHNLNDEKIVEHLTRKLGNKSARLMKSNTAIEGIGVANLMAATGLECPIVIILGLDELIAEEANPTLSPEEAAERRLTNTRQIYMGITRAMERLVVYASHDRLRNAFGL